MLMKEFNFMRTMSLYMKTINTRHYIEECSVFEREENQKILELIGAWLGKLEEDIKEEILSSYNYPEVMGKYDIEQISDILYEKNDAFKSIVDNMKYVPIQPPFLTLKTMIDEILSNVTDEARAENIYYKNISEYNFTESKMKNPRYRNKVKEEIRTKIGHIPDVLSMTVLYHNNPLMWPLIFHEYAHIIFERIKHKDRYSEMYSRIRVESENLNLDQVKLDAIISEIFSNIFAINSYQVIYFYAFCFHEIYSSNMNQLVDFPENGSHPPSSIRMKYMIREISKRGFDKDEAFQIVIETQKEFSDELYRKVDEKADKRILGLFDRIYGEISCLFDDEFIFSRKIEIDHVVIKDLHDKLRNRYPIGTSYDKNINLRNDLIHEDIFNIEVNNNVTSMIYAGWKFLLLDILHSFFTTPSHKAYLKNCRLRSDETDGKKNIEIKVLKFLKEFKFLLSNIIYSMETSMIVSYYLEGK